MNKMGAGSGRKMVHTADQPGAWNPNGGHVQNVNPYKQRMEDAGCQNCGHVRFPMVSHVLMGNVVILCGPCSADVGGALLQDAGRAQAIEDKG